MEYLFSELFNWESGKPISPTEGNVPIYGSNGIIGYTNVPKYLNKIIIGRVGAYCGSVAYCKSEFNATDNTLIGTCNTDRIVYSYAYYLLKLFNLNKYSGGAAQPLITQSILKRLKCDIPTLPIQKKIANFLDYFGDLIENFQKQISLLEEAAQRLYKEWFVKFRFPGHENTEFVDGIPVGWRNATIGDIVQFKRGKTITKKDIVEGNIPVVAGGMEPAYYCDKYNTEAPVITVSGSGANAGFTRMYFEKVWASDCSYIDITAPSFYQIYCFLKTNKALINNLQKGAAQPHVYPKDINALQIVIPIDDISNQFEDIVKPIFDEQANLTKQIKALTEARDRLLPKLMSGEIEIN